ncbi:MAG: hypothetical protein AAF517_20955, partial [Planctomycetota bacterium]
SPRGIGIHLERLVELAPESWRYRWYRADHRAETKPENDSWQSIRDELDALEPLGSRPESAPLPPSWTYRRALLALETGDRESWAKLVAELLNAERIPGARDAALRAMSLGKHADLDRGIKLANNAKPISLARWRGRLLYRAGRFEEAAQALTPPPRDPTALSRPKITSITIGRDIVRAMAEIRSENAETSAKAPQTLQGARAHYARFRPHWKSHWYDRVELEMLFAEAAKIVPDAPPAPKTPGGLPIPPGGFPIKPGTFPVPPGGLPIKPGSVPIKPGALPMKPGDPKRVDGVPKLPVPPKTNTKPIDKE